jgi:ketosteroid isomerase-like protein
MFRSRKQTTLGQIPPVTLLLAACAPVGLTGSAADQVLRTDEARRTATLEGDVALLDRLIADDATLVYGDGTTETKASLLAEIRSGKLRWTKLEYDRAGVRVYGDVVILTGVAHSRTNGGPEHTVYVTRIYARQRGSWRLIASQTTRTAGSP